MNTMALCLVMQVCLAFGVAGLVWPEKFMPLFGILMFPWPASFRAIRLNCVAFIGVYVIFIGKVVVVGL